MNHLIELIASTSQVMQSLLSIFIFRNFYEKIHPIPILIFII